MLTRDGPFRCQGCGATYYQSAQEGPGDGYCEDCDRKVGDAQTLLYFWKDKEDPKAWCDYERWAADNPALAARLEKALRRLKKARRKIVRTIESFRPVAEENDDD